MLAKVKYYCKYFQIAMTPKRDFGDIIAIVMVFYSLHKDFYIMIISFLKTSDKIIN